MTSCVPVGMERRFGAQRRRLRKSAVNLPVKQPPHSHLSRPKGWDGGHAQLELGLQRVHKLTDLKEQVEAGVSITEATG
jgi:hypothetical protein